jgi:alkanesulfonate monooxygenase SsuD/methylene tetrahydromethanopterin reductase-like flavin-dependent oxidoreductase (luciferase family)
MARSVHKRDARVKPAHDNREIPFAEKVSGTAMKVFIFDLLAYGHQFEDYKRAKFIPYPLPRDHFDPEIAARTYEEHLEAWEEMDRLGFDGVGLNEHHTTPHGLMNSPNMMAAAAAQRTKKLKFLMLGNILPIHNPLRIAEEIAMADCLSRGRIISGFARGVPREYNVYNVPMAQSRARFEEAVDVILKAWKEPVFSHQGKFWQFQDIAIWPRPYQQPHPPVWVPFTGSKETIEWAARHNFFAVLPDFKRGLTEDIVGYFAKQLAMNGHAITPEHLCFFTDAWVAENKVAALREYGPSYFYFVHTLWHHGSTKEKEAAVKTSGYVSSSSFDYMRPENRSAAGLDREKMKAMTQADVEKRIDDGLLAFGDARHVAERLIDAAEHYGANSLLLMMNLGALPHDQFMEQLRRFGTEVLPKLKAHEVKRVRLAA